MPPRRVTLAPGEYYHVYNRGVERSPIFFDRADYVYFLRKARQHLFAVIAPLSRTLAETHSFNENTMPSVRDSSPRPVSVLAYCLMPNHFHFLVYLRCTDFSRRMYALQKAYSQSINRSRERAGPLFQGRFRAKHVDREEYLSHLSRYIHLNPVAGNLVASPADWEFSSYGDYNGQRRGTLPERRVILSMFESAAAYCHFVERGTSVTSPKLSRLLIDN